MATQNLSRENFVSVESVSTIKIGIVVSQWNEEVTGALADGAVETLKAYGLTDDQILVKRVPGSFELTLGGQFLAEYTDVDAVILLGCVIQGETKHFDFVCQGVTHGTTELNLRYGIPFIFGLLTTDNQQQALDRAGGRLGNKGVEGAHTAMHMVQLQRSFSN